MFDAVDTLVDTKAKRHALLGLYCCLWIFWQIIWNVLVFWQVVQVRDYDGLFVLLNDLSGWTSCFLVRLLLYGVNAMTGGWQSVLYGLGTCFRPADVLFLFFGVLFLSGMRKKMAGLSLLIELILLVFVILTCAVICLSASSIMQVVSVLKTACTGALVMSGLMFISTLVLFIEQIIALQQSPVRFE